MRSLFATTLGCFLTACASLGPSRPMPAEPQLERIRALHAAEDWSGLSELAGSLLQEFDFEAWSSQDVQLALWRIVEATQRSGAADTEALALRGLARCAAPDAPLALVDFVAAHGPEPLARCGALERPEVAAWLAMDADCRRGDWAGARARIALAFPDADGETVRHAFASRLLLGDLLRRAERYEPALVEYTAATFARVLASDPRGDDPYGGIAAFEQTLGCVRLESLLFEMGEGAWGLTAMEIVNRQRELLDYHPRSRAADQARRDEAGAEAEVLSDIIWNYDNPAAPELPPLAADLAALAVFEAPRLAGSTSTWHAPGLGLTLVATDEALRVESALESVGAYSVALSTEAWERGPKCWVYTEPDDAHGRCVRRFRDGSIFVGSSGFDSDGLLLRRGREPYTGAGLFGRPAAEAVQVVGFRQNEPAGGPSLAGLGERRRFVANVACGAFLIGEGYVQGDQLVPDGVVRLAYSHDTWFRSRFTAGVAGPWRRSGNAILRSDLTRIEDLAGEQVVWVDPGQWRARIEQTEALRASAEREQFERELQAQLAVWASMDQGGGHGAAAPAAPAGAPCYRCDGSGSIYQAGGWESYTYYEQSDPSSLPTPRSGTRWVNGARETCPQCNGTGRQ